MVRRFAAIPTRLRQRASQVFSVFAIQLWRSRELRPADASNNRSNEAGIRYVAQPGIERRMRLLPRTTPSLAIANISASSVRPWRIGLRIITPPDPLDTK